MFDHFYKKINDPKLYGMAMELLAKYDLASSGNYDDIDRFLSELDDDDSELLELAIRARQESSNSQKTKTTEYEVNHSNTEEDINLSELIKKFMEYKIDSDIRSASNSWYSGKTEKFGEILKTLNDGKSPSISRLTVSDIRRFHKIMKCYPKNPLSQVRTRDLTELQRIHLAENHSREQLTEMGIQVLSQSTINDYFMAIRELLRFAEAQQYPIKPGLGTILQGVNIKEKQTKQGKFDSLDLKKIFNSRHYKTGSFKRNSEYWLPLLSVFGGQTQAELCQLHVSDIRKQTDQKSGTVIWYIDINDEEEKVLKNKSGRPRKVPIHNRLIELGFLEFVEICKNKGNKRLFPEEIRNQNEKYPGYSKRFNRFKGKVGIESNSQGKKTFHSFRHTVSNYLFNIRCEDGTVNDILGHESEDRSESRKTYTEELWLSLKNEWIQKLDYEIDWSQVKTWKETKLN